MALLTIQLDLRLRRLGDEGLEDVVSTFTHYDLPPGAAGGDWPGGDVDLVARRVLAHLLGMLEVNVPQLLDHCQWEQRELPFG